MLPVERLQTLIESKDTDAAVYGEGWAIIDGALVIYDFEAPPGWLAPVLAARDDDGNTGGAS